MKKHLTTDELVDRLYGVGGDAYVDAHFAECEECSGRFRVLGECRAMVAEAKPVSYDFLAAQRRNIYARMGERPQARMKWLPALAAGGCLVVVGVLAPYHRAQVATPEVADAQLFTDVYSIEQTMEPIAAQPIDALFDQDQQ